MRRGGEERGKIADAIYAEAQAQDDMIQLDPSENGDDDANRIALMKWSSDVVARVPHGGFEIFDLQLDLLIKNALIEKKNNDTNNDNNNNNKRVGKEDEKEREFVDVVKSGDLAHLGFPFDGGFGVEELKESVGLAFANQRSPVKTAMTIATAATSKTAKKNKQQNSKRIPNEITSIDDAWAKISGVKLTTEQQAKAEKLLQNSGATIGGDVANGSLAAQKSNFSAGARDLANNLGVNNTLSSVPFIRNMTSFDVDIARTLNTFGSGSGSGKFDGHIAPTSAEDNEAITTIENMKREHQFNRHHSHHREDSNKNNNIKREDNENLEQKKKRKVSKTNVPRVAIGNDKIVELTKGNLDVIVTSDGGLKNAMPPRKKGRRPNEGVHEETEEEKKIRAEERIYKNRQSAARSRARKLKTIAELQEEIDKLNARNFALEKLAIELGATEKTITDRIAKAEATRIEEKAIDALAGGDFTPLVEPENGKEIKEKQNNK